MFRCLTEIGCSLFERQEIVQEYVFVLSCGLSCLVLRLSCLVFVVVLSCFVVVLSCFVVVLSCFAVVLSCLVVALPCDCCEYDSLVL